MKICIENLEKIIEKYRPLILSMVSRFPYINDSYMKACDYVLDIVKDYDEKKGGFGAFIKFRLYYYFLDLSKDEKVISLYEKDEGGVCLIEKIPDDFDIESKLIEKDDLKNLKKEIGKLSKTDKKIIYLKYFENFSHKKIGEILNISPKTVTNRHGIIMRKMRENLKKKEIF